MPRGQASAAGLFALACLLTILRCVRAAAESPREEVEGAYAHCRDVKAHSSALALERPFDGAWRRGRSLERGEFADVWLENGQIRAVDLQTGGEDNAITVRHCFRDDGSLAFVHTSLSTFYADPGPVRVERRLYFDASGKRFRSREQIYDVAGTPVHTEFGRFALVFERVFRSDVRMRGFFGRALALRSAPAR